MKHLISDANSQIRTYQNKFTELRVAYSARAMLDVKFLSCASLMMLMTLVS